MLLAIIESPTSFFPLFIELLDPAVLSRQRRDQAAFFSWHVMGRLPMLLGFRSLVIWCRPGGGFSGMLGRIRRRQELRAAQEKARSGKVTLARQYRAGEMPDIQSITLQSFLAPLGEPLHLRLNAIECSTWCQAQEAGSAQASSLQHI